MPKAVAVATKAGLYCVLQGYGNVRLTNRSGQILYCLVFELKTGNDMRILTCFVVVQENIKPEVFKVQSELARSMH